MCDCMQNLLQAIAYKKQSNLKLMLKGNEGLKTPMGIILSYIIIIAVFCYACYELKKLVNHEDLKLNSNFSGDLEFPQEENFNLEVAYRANITRKIRFENDETFYPRDLNFTNCTFCNATSDIASQSQFWAQMDLTCSQSLENALREAGYDPKEFFCLKQDNSLQIRPGFPDFLNYDNGDYLDYYMTLKTVCIMNTFLNFSNYQDVAKKGLDCYQINKRANIYGPRAVSIRLKLFRHIVKTTSSIIFGSKETKYYETYEVYTIKPDLKFYTTIILQRPYLNYDREYTQIWDSFGTVKGFWQTMFLIAIPFGFILAFQQKIYILKYVGFKKNNQWKMGCGAWLLAKLGKSKYKYMKQIEDEMNDKLELKKLANF